MIIEIGRLVTKIAGRDAAQKAVIVDILDDKHVLIDGQTRRRKCNILHIEPLNQIIEIKKNASHEEVTKALEQLGMVTRTTKPKQKTEKPKKKRKTSDQLREQKEEKRKIRDLFKFKKEEVKPVKSDEVKPSLALPSIENKEDELEEKVGLFKEEDKKIDQ